MDQKQKQHLLKTIREIKPPGEKVFLVGGAVRDQILDLPIHDLDFAVKDDPELLARKLANTLKAGFYVLDDLRNTARVVLKTNSDMTTTLDFARFRGSSILEDLGCRDFTGNAMAIDLDHPTQIVDPLDGKGSLKSHQLQLCSPVAFSDDPVRVLRAVRFSLKFHLAIGSALMKSLKKSAPLVTLPSKERQRDEFFQILALDQVDEGIHLLDELGIIDLFFPAISTLKKISLPLPSTKKVWEHTQQVLKGLNRIESWIISPALVKGSKDPLGEAFITSLKKFFPKILEYVSGYIVAERNRKSLLAFAALMHATGVKACQSIDWDGSTRFYYLEKISADIAVDFAAGFALGNKEQEFIRQVITNHSLPENLRNSIYPLDKRTIYRFFQTTADAGIAVCLLAMADSLAIHDFSVPMEKWKTQLAITKYLFHSWWSESNEIINIKPILTGDDLKKEFFMKEGPRIGSLLESLKEEQASGAIKTRAKAITFIKQFIESGNEKKQG